MTQLPDSNLPDNPHEASLMRQALNASARKAELLDSSAALAILRVRLQQEETKVVQSNSPVWRRPFAQITAFAAVTVAVLLVSFLPSVRSLFSSPASPAYTLREYVTPRGRRASVTLVDGTRVELNVASKLRVPSNFASNRQVYLDGEAQFTVTHNSKHPFVVYAGNTIVRDLATVFSVRAYAGSKSQVAVSDGSVSVHTDAVLRPNSTTLTCGDAVVVHNDGTLGVTRNADVAALNSWTRDVLIFQDTPVPEALAQLGRWFDVKFEIADSSLAYRDITTEVSGNSLTNAQLRGIAAALNARIERRGGVIVLHGMSQ